MDPVHVSLDNSFAHAFLVFVRTFIFEYIYLLLHVCVLPFLANVYKVNCMHAYLSVYKVNCIFAYLSVYKVNCMYPYLSVHKIICMYTYLSVYAKN